MSYFFMEKPKAKENYDFELEVLYSTLRRTHRDFINKMYPEFGLQKPPKEVNIICNEEKSSFFDTTSSIRNNRDHINYLWKHKKLDTLDCFITIECQDFKCAANARKEFNPSFCSRGNMKMRLFPKEWVDYMHKVQSDCIHESSHYLHFLSYPESFSEDEILSKRFIEFVADLGSLTYIHKRNQLLLMLPNEVKTESYIMEMFLAVYGSFKCDSTLLRKITNMDLESARALVDGYIRKYHPDPNFIENKQKELQTKLEDTTYDGELPTGPFY